MTTELNFDTEILTEERVRVFRIIIGSASASVTVSLQPGWNLVSFPITPNDSDPDAVFSNHTGRVITGVVWGYRDGSYSADLMQAFYYDAANRDYMNAIDSATGIDIVTFETSRGYWVESNRERQFRFR